MQWSSNKQNVFSLLFINTKMYVQENPPCWEVSSPLALPLWWQNETTMTLEKFYLIGI